MALYHRNQWHYITGVGGTMATGLSTQIIYEQTIVQQKLGTATITDILLADNSLREAQQTYLSAVIDYLKADLELKKFTGNITSTK